MIDIRTEKEKMLAGEMYNCGGPELVKSAVQCRLLVDEYNKTTLTEMNKRKEFLKAMLKSVGTEVIVDPPFFCAYGENVSIGDRSFLNNNCILQDACPITIGNDVLIGPGCKIISSSHPLDYRLRKNENRGLCISKPVTIGNDVFIGAGVIILPGVTIGDRAMVGAGSVVTNDVAPDTVVAGNPAKIIRKLEFN